MILYLIKSTLCLTFILGFYHLILERENMHRFTRFFLLTGLGFSFLIPLIQVGLAEPSPFITKGNYYFAKLSLNSISAPPVQSQFDQDTFFLLIYLSVTVFLLLRFIIQISTLLRATKKHRTVPYKSATLVLLKEQSTPYSFGKFIYISNASYLSESIEDELLSHELAHVNQKHSIDILLLEICRIVFWFNPMLILYKRAIQTNHEYLADQAVIQSHKHIPSYKNLLLQTASGHMTQQLSSNFTFSLTKKRLIMMTKQTSKLRSNIFTYATIPLLGVLMLFFGKTSFAQHDDTNQNAEVRAMVDAYFKDAVFVCSNDQGVPIYTPYQALSEEEKNKIPPPAAEPDAPLAPLPAGTVVQLKENGQVIVQKNSIAPPPPPAPPAPKPESAPAPINAKPDQQ